MKQSTILKLLFVVAATSAHAVPTSESRIVELPIARVFIPARGFDDNDTVEAVIDGELPNTCYNLEKQSIVVDAKAKTVTIRQFAIRLNSGLCKEGSEPPSPEFVTPIPFTETVSIGKLAMGAYNIVYSPDLSKLQMKAFDVGLAAGPNRDTLPYAMITEVSVSDVIILGKPITVQISGILNNSCYSLNEKIGVEKIDDVTVILPTVNIDHQGACLMYIRPFTKTLTLDPISNEARYLVHVRSMHGKSLNRVYSVVKPPL